MRRASSPRRRRCAGSSASFSGPRLGPVDPISPYGVAKPLPSATASPSVVSTTRRDRGAAALQRLRPAPKPALAVRRRRTPLHHSDRDRRARDHLRRRRPVTQLRLRRQRSRRRPARGGRPRGERARLNIAAGARHTVNQLADTIGDLLEKTVDKRHEESPGRHPRLVRRRQRGTGRLGWEPTHRFRGRAAAHRPRSSSCRAHLDGFLGRRRVRPAGAGSPPGRVRVLPVIAAATWKVSSGRAGAARRLPLGRPARSRLQHTLVAGSLALGEESMAVVAERLASRS